ncbi:CLUMA_CG003027, isoform A [Clunio marinus]|uniref:CLUMA_CG003027, isoform A n=1 Tax=Clunio marinus TaxID=568069 RepID=A0A1J1HPF1_9DIPT|nr:CLUMA_CG003027, isoform A [Clunio marinus]
MLIRLMISIATSTTCHHICNQFLQRVSTFKVFFDANVQSVIEDKQQQFSHFKCSSYKGNNDSTATTTNDNLQKNNYRISKYKMFVMSSDDVCLELWNSFN